MKKYLLCTLATAVLVGLSQDIFCQRPIVTISLGNKKVEGDIPFDEEFTIKGPVDKDVLNVTFKYRVKGGIDVTTQYWPAARDAEGYSTPVSEWNRDGDEFYFDCGRLHPNVTYEFHFTLKKKITVEDQVREEIKQAMIDRLKVFFAQNNITAAKINNLRTELTDIVKNKLNLPGRLIDRAGNTFSVGPFVPPLKVHVDRIDRLVSQIKADSTNVALIARATNLNTSTVMDPIERSLEEILTEKIKLGPRAVELLKEPLDPSNKEFAAIDGNDFLEFYVNVLSNPNEMKKLLTGSAKIEGKRLVSSTDIHLPSVMLLSSFLSTLQNRFLTLAQTPKQISAGVRPVHVFSTARLTALDGVQREVELYIKDESAVRRNRESLTKLINDFPNVLIDVFQEQQFQLFEQPTIDITSNKNPYVGIDLGFVWAPGIQTFFAYQGLNMYLVPVNKNTPLNVYEKKDKFLKKFSIFLGVTENVTKANYDRYENLIAGTGSILVGCGWRITRSLRGNVGGMLFYQKDQNPVIDDSHFAVAPSVSLSIDINISKAFGDLSKVFKIQ
jgi:hypothetical protein